MTHLVVTVFYLGFISYIIFYTPQIIHFRNYLLYLKEMKGI